MTITYEVGSGLYVNTTNRCTNACEFCVRSTVESFYGDLWLEREPTVEEICGSIFSRTLSRYSELVFCGYGEPMMRLDDILEVARRVKEKASISIRINTNGQGNLIAGRDITPKLKGLIDCVSISLNTADARSYQHICHSVYGEAAYYAIQDFARAAVRYVPKVIFSVVDKTISDEAIEVCRKIAADCGVTLRVRDLIESDA